MNKFGLTRGIALSVCLLTLIIAIGQGVLVFIGVSLSNAWETQSLSSADLTVKIIPVMAIFILGLVTGIGSLGLKYRVWRVLYILLCLLVGIGAVFSFLSVASQGYKSAILMALVGIIYISLAYMTKKQV
ncbi:putative membrane protein (Fun14 family) [Pullulanibacillus pueri]|uniref:Uncharacterized protein n=1 Tax=Pullulanibacillus pueri TaxID=1437324 RepID=A0A8J2ZVZ5_9BACL|nr:hypothetical protein [Pullulanibacillus pueri]MBM7680953.1 putative membrane protein (Fun14 family) [Pullulanibacillus pueri]GGH81470.1 hypothetical protein GCM10007096_19420 [Pullulanibacillus pueri]